MNVLPLLIALLMLPLSAMPQLILPTENTAVFQSRPNDFFMYVNRHFEGKDSKPWSAGTYGFVRNMKRTSEGVIGTRFHEGADIKPARRDSKGEPLDRVLTIADGTVAYVNDKSTASNYGKYVVVVHNWGEGPICSLYAHLNHIYVKEGDVIKQGVEIGLLGYTGRGIDRTRAHLHFEVGLMLSNDFETWHTKHYGAASGHGNFNGRNLTGMNGIDLIGQQKDGKIKSIKQYLATQTAYYAITVPVEMTAKLKTRYPWLWRSPQGSAGYAQITFSASGLPLVVTPSNRKVSSPTITGLKPFPGLHSDRTIGRISGSGQKGKLTNSGKRYIELILGQY